MALSGTASRQIKDGFDQRGCKVPDSNESIFSAECGENLARNNMLQKTDSVVCFQFCGAQFQSPAFCLYVLQRLVAEAALVYGDRWHAGTGKGCVLLSNVPESISEDLDKGRKGLDIALELLADLQEIGIKRIYLIAPILKGGTRDYEAAQAVIEATQR